MESLDFTQPAPVPPTGTPAEASKPPSPPPASTYDAAAATAFFKEWGTVESVPAGKVLFREDEQRGFFSGDDRMYLLLEGTVGLSLDGKSIDTLNPGEIFGEMTSLANTRRSATATAKSDCRVIALEGGQFKKAIQRQPDFVLLMMTVMVNRFRLTLARLAIKRTALEPADGEEDAVFDANALNRISAALDHPASLRYLAGQTIISPGDAGVFMYFPREGRVAIMNQERTLQRVGVGSVFGEMALIDSAARSAKVVAETDCVLMAVSRAQFLQLVQSNPDVGLALLKLLARRLKATTVRSSR